MVRTELVTLLYDLEHNDGRDTGLIVERALPIVRSAMASPGSFPLASVLCTATLGVPIRNEDLAARLGRAWVNDSERDENSIWGWPFSDIRRLQPYVPARGMQGFWSWKVPHYG